ncbi:MAG TPA: tubulin-like doman-containing protein [Ktedonobacterales bacterium]
MGEQDMTLNAATGAEDRPRSPAESQIAVPSLNIFLGSTPSYAALEVMRQLVYLSPADQRRVALVFLDIDSPPAEIQQFRQEHLGVLREFDLRISVAHGVVYADQLPQDIANHTYIPTKIPESFDNGAGGIRNNGHVAACTDRAKIDQLLEEALSAIGALPPERGARPVTEVQVNIVAFLGGGTGSGILPDIAVMARHRILQRNLKHRLNVFCLLPEHVREATTNDVSWRKSNATATLMELIALSLVREKQGGARYTKYMAETPYEVRGETIANEVYLFGKTSMVSAEDAARIIGLDLYMRITNASGVGFLERSKAVDRRTLGNFDRNGLPTMFGTTCPLEVAFPAVETATAFARLTASKVLPLLARDMSEQRGQLSASDLDEVKEWDRALQPEDPSLFSEKSFQTAGRDRLDMLEARLSKQVQEATDEIAELAARKEEEEKRRVYSAALEPLGVQIARLETRRRIYSAALARVQDQSVPSKGRPDRQLQRKLLRPLPLPGAKDRSVAAVTDDFNRIQRRNVRNEYLTRKKRLLAKLLEHVDAELQHVKRFQGDVEIEQSVRDLEKQATSSAAWRGELDNTHIHRRHIFDLPGMPGMNTGGLSSPPVERLYEYMTSRDLASYAQRFTEWIQTRHGADAALATGTGSELRDRLVQFLRDEVYLKRLHDMNLFELLEVCCVEPGERADHKIENILLAHLQHIGGLARELVAFEAQLWHEGSGMLSTSLYMGMSWKNGSQRRILDHARSRLGAIAKEGAAPMLASAIDPHRMQLAYGQHAISLGTIPDFYQDANSSMGEFLRHQSYWFDQTGQRPYGQSRAPVFSSGEMERLIMDRNALGDGKHTLPERIIRHVQHGAGDAPSWATTSQPGIPPLGQPGNGYAPTAPANGQHAPQQPRYPQSGVGGPGGYGSSGNGGSSSF